MMSLPEVAKAGASLVGVLYGFGFTVVSVHLARYSVSPYGLLRTQYLLAGIWLLVPLVLVALPALWMIAALRHQDNPSDDKLEGWRRVYRRAGKIWQALWLTSTIVLLLILFSNTLLPVDLLTAGRRLDVSFLSRHALTTLVFGVSLVTASTGAGYCARKARQGNDRVRQVRSYLWAAMLASVTLIVLFMYIGHFAVTAYPRIPASIGGGEPVSLRFLLKSDEAAKPVAASKQQLTLGTNSFELVSETADEYIVVTPADHSRTVVVRKSEVLGAILSRPHQVSDRSR
jgi:hypothetical protein